MIEWLSATTPDVVCLQESKAPQQNFPENAIRAAGYSAIWLGQESWNGVAILARGSDPVETQRGLPGDPDDLQGRYLEAAVDGVLVGYFYTSYGNPRPGPKFDYKLAWLDRIEVYAAELLATGLPILLASDYNIMPTPADVYRPERWTEDALFAPEVRAAFFRLIEQGWTDTAETAPRSDNIHLLELLP